MYLMKKLSVFAAMLLVFAGWIAFSQTAGPKHHVVFQLDEEEGKAWGALIVHVNNTMNALADDGGSEVEVVFYGAGLLMLKKTNTAYAERLEQLSKRGVKLIACRNAMKVRNVKTEEMFPFVGQVDSGIAEMVRKQEAGWAYVH